MNVPEYSNITVTFGINREQLDRLPKYEEIAPEFHGFNSVWVKGVSAWFSDGGKRVGNGIELGGRLFTCKDGVDYQKALSALKAVIGSFEPSHEHKIALAAFMLREWFDTDIAAAKPKESEFEIRLRRRREINESVERDQEAAELRTRRIANGELVLPEVNRPYELWDADKTRHKTYRSRESLDMGYKTHDGERLGLVMAFCAKENQREWL